MNTNQQEWLQLQRVYDQMEVHALWLKAVCLLSWLTLVFVKESLVMQLGSVLIFWWLEASWRAQQQRAAQRLLALEQATAAGQDIACSWHSHWQQQRPSLAGLLTDYLVAAIKPTVAVVYLGLLAASFIRVWY